MVSLIQLIAISFSEEFKVSNVKSEIFKKASVTKQESNDLGLKEINGVFYESLDITLWSS